MQLAQAMAQRSPVFKPQVMPNQIMQNEQALQQVNQANAQAALTDPGDEKRKLAEALAGRGFSKANDLWGVAANALEGYNLGKAQKEAKEEAEAKKKYDSAKNQLIAASLPEQYRQIAQADPELAVKLIGINEKQSMFGNGMQSKLAELNYKEQIQGLTPEEQAQKRAISEAFGVQYISDAEGRPMGLPKRPVQSNAPLRGQIPLNAPLPPASPAPSIEDAPANMFLDGTSPDPAPVTNNQGFVTKTEQALNEATGKANLDVSKDIMKKSIEDADNAIPNTSIVNEMGMNLASIGDTNSLSGVSQFVSRNWNALGLPLDAETAKVLSSQEATDSTKGELLSRIIKDYGAGTGISNADLLSAEKRLPGITNTPLGNRLILANIARGFLAKLERSEAALSKGQFKNNPDVQQRLQQVRNALSSFNRDLALPVVINEDHAAELIKSGMIKLGSEVILGTMNGQTVPFSQMRKVKIKAE